MDPNKKFNFVRPPECPVFEPGAEEFSNFEEYIEKIKPLAVQYGLCKIKSPHSWKPPFMADPFKFKFTPRVQRLNEIEANTRVKWMFLTNLDKFWNLQGFNFKNPTIDGKYLDFFKLKKTVDEVGGFEATCTNKLWNVVAERLELSGKKAPSLLKSHYEKYLYPYDIFQAGIHNQQVKVISNNSKHSLSNEDDADCNPRKRNKISRNQNKDYRCQSCERGDDDDVLLLCDGCDEAYHTFCLIPPLNKIPPGDWLCPCCVAKECNQSPATYGFEQAEQEYSLDSFTKMADEFKRKYFNMDPKLVPCDVVETEFWRILSAGDDVVVNYGADNPANVYGSGFPTSRCNNNSCEDNSYQNYVESSWNLNNLSVLPTSTLRFIEEEVSGMKVPWCYVGMVFSCFSWHTEDHYSYSVNYMHWGEPKTWYGVGGDDACKLEECMLYHVPELFKYSPDLMHQLTTLLSPSILMSFGVPITRTDQYPGDFIITFPRAYHAGFNQGINFAEAVNYCPADWVKMGRFSVIEYKNVKRACVFSLDELFCKMTHHLNDLQIELVRILLDDLQSVFRFEDKMLQRAVSNGSMKKERLIFENLCDDERICCICQTTCFLHAVVCNCSNKQKVMSCLEHWSDMCSCSQGTKKILFRYDDQEMKAILEKLKRRLDRWDGWKKQVDEVMGKIGNHKPVLCDVERLMEMHNQAKFPLDKTSQHLTDLINGCKLVVERVRSVMPSEAFIVVHTRSKKPLVHTDSSLTKPSFEMLLTLMKEMDSLICLPQHEYSYLTTTIQSINIFIKEYNNHIKSHDITGPMVKKIVFELIKSGSKLYVNLDEFDALLKISDQFNWLDEVEECSNNQSDLRELKLLVNKGNQLIDQSSCRYFINELNKLNEFYIECSKLEERSCQLVTLVSTSFMKSHRKRETVTMAVLKDILERAEKLKFKSSYIESVEDICLKVHEWEGSIQQLIDRPHKVHLHELQDVIKKVDLMPIDAHIIDQLKSMLHHCKEWLNKWNQFIGSIKPTSYSLINKLIKFHDCKGKCYGEESICDAVQDLNVTECMAAIKNIRRYNIKMASQPQQLMCSICNVNIINNNYADNSVESVVACVVCNTILHDKCLRNQLIKNTSMSGCPSCQPMNSHIDVKVLRLLVDEYMNLKMCLWQGEMLVTLTNHVESWQESVQSFISSDDVVMLMNSIIPLMKTHSNVDMIMSVVMSSLKQQKSLSSSSSMSSFVTIYERLIDLLLNGFITNINMQTNGMLSCFSYCVQVTYGNKIKNKWKLTCNTSASASSSSSSLSSSSLSPTPTSSSLHLNNENNKMQNAKKRSKKVVESCSLGSSCQLPSSRKLDWVQCDMCDNWYHMICLKLTVSEIDIDGVFVCPACETSTSSMGETLSSPCQTSFVAY